MKTRMISRVLLAAAAAGAFSGAAHAKNYYLKAVRFEQVIDGETIPMWGYDLCHSADVNDCDNAPSAPGPEIWAYDDQRLVIYLYNDLRYGSESGPAVALDGGATSITVPGMPLGRTASANTGPVFWGDEHDAVLDGAVSDTLQPDRVRSMSHETINGAGWTRYVWPGVDPKNPGTYIYHSATHPGLQVQMGLFGPLTIINRSGEAYPGVAVDANLAGPSYGGLLVDSEAELFYSEIDSAFHADVDAGLSGYDPDGDPNAVRTSPIDYHPDHYLINGAPSDGAFNPTLDDPTGGGLAVDPAAQTVLVRFRSAALTSHAPMAPNGDPFNLIAETAMAYPDLITDATLPDSTRRRQSSLLLPALTTADAVLSSAHEGANVMLDRMLGYKNSGGMTAMITVPDDVRVLKPSCTSSGRLNIRVRTRESASGPDQVVAARVSDGAIVLDNTSVSYHKDVTVGAASTVWHQFRWLVSAAQSADFCPIAAGSTLTVTGVTGSGGTHTRSFTY